MDRTVYNNYYINTISTVTIILHETGSRKWYMKDMKDAPYYIIVSTIQTK